MAKCPHCEGDVALATTREDEASEVHKSLDGLIKKGVMYSCPHCQMEGRWRPR